LEALNIAGPAGVVAQRRQGTCDNRAVAASIRIGTSGWNYPRGEGRWNGVFYPARRPKGFDELAFYADFFDTVEINSTFYGMPRPEVAAGWADRTPPGFEFAVKLYQQFTHPKMFRARVEQELAKALGSSDLPEAAIAALTKANQADIDEFRRGVAPLADAGKLGPLLAQFPASFRDTPENRAHLATLLRAFSGHTLAVELRHRSWSDRMAETRALLDAFGAAWTWIDEPKFKDSVRQPEIEPSSVAYLRLHGRNAKEWWHHADRDARYRYTYSAEELAPIAEKLTAVAAKNYKAYAYLNNHPDARAVTNAKMLKALVGQETRELPVTVGVGERAE
jgi:uncharacterized protein YecE (DUF72 family)